MAPQSGLNVYVGIGEESVYGTGVARDRFLTVNSETIARTEERVNSNDLYRTGLHKSQRAQGNVQVGGGLVYRPRYNQTGFTRLLKHLFGSVATAQPDVTSNPTVYRHTFTPAATGQALPTGLSIEKVLDSLALLSTGCKINSGRFNVAQGQPLELSCDIIGQEQASVLPTAISIVESEMVMCNSGSIVFNSGSEVVTAADLSFNNNLGTVYSIGSRLTREPWPTGHRGISGSFTAQLEDLALFNAFAAMTRASLVFTFTGGAITGGYTYEVLITMPVTELTQATPQANTMGWIPVSCNFESLVDDSNASEITLRVTNTQSAA